MNIFQVRTRYNPSSLKWPEGSQYNVREGLHELLLPLNDLSQEEITGVRTGDSEFALAVHGDIISLLFRFGQAIPWSDAPFSWHLVPQDQRTLPAPEMSLETKAIVNIALIESSTGILKALRAVTLSTEFTRLLHHVIYEQANNPWPGGEAYDRQLANVYKRYPTSEALLETAIVKTRWGA
jgi:hypothetical protein